MYLTFIAALVFLSVFTFIYQLYLYKRMHLSLGVVDEEASIAKARAAQPRESALRRLLKPFAFLAELKLARFLPGRSVPARLVMAGSPINIIEFAIFKILSMVVFAVIGSIVSQGRNIILYSTGGLIAGFIIPDFWLNLKIKRRHLEMRRDLPQVIDLLNLCVDAGLDFMLAVNRVVRDFKKCPLTDELSEVWRETKMGASRREALQHLSRRVNLPELSSFVRTLLQADRMGSSMGEALKIQSEEIRQSRYLRGEELALKAPIKLLFPLFFFILPVVLVIVAGPILLQFVRGGGIKF